MVGGEAKNREYVFMSEGNVYTLNEYDNYIIFINKYIMTVCRV